MFNIKPIYVVSLNQKKFIIHSQVMFYDKILSAFRYTSPIGMDSESHGSQKSNIESGQVTLYIPKVKKEDGSKTLIRRRRTSSKKRSSSKRRQERETLSDLLNDEDNHILPSLRLQRRSRMKTLKGNHGHRITITQFCYYKGNCLTLNANSRLKLSVLLFDKLDN